ncbi:MAG: GWxTD domain-containing protein [Ignavibacteria bacterium]|nr:GWxTD domain-containing protein [Ignavibacteria bacterium]
MLRAKKQLIPSLFLFFIFTNISFSQNNLSFDYDFSIFRDEGTKVFVELYYGFDPHDLIFIKSGNNFEATGKFQLDIINKLTSNTVVMKEFRVPVTLSDTSGVSKNFHLTGQLNIVLDSGTYIIKLSAGDLNNEHKVYNSQEEVHLSSFPEKNVSISTIELGTKIIKSTDESNIFYKNTLEVTPNPSNLYGKNLSKLYYYIELYNLNNKELGESFSVITSLANQDGSEINNYKKTYDLKTESKVEYGSIDISALKSNKYLFLVKLTDSKENEILRAYKYFFVYNSDSAVVQTNLTEIENEYLLSEYSKMPEKQVDDEFNKAIYLMSDKQKDKYESLKNLDEKRMYMFKYWKGISSYINKKDYFSRIDFANKNFKSDLREGWKTDRGRIYAIYGKYDEIERYPYEGSTRAYEIWTYNNIQGGVIFVFVDNSTGLGDYTLVHSTAQNEINDEFWKDKININ